MRFLKLENFAAYSFLVFLILTPLVYKIQLKSGNLQDGIYVEPLMPFLIASVGLFLLSFWREGRSRFWGRAREFFIPHPIAKLFYLLLGVLFLSWIYGVILTGNSATGDLLRLGKYGLYFLIFPLSIQSGKILGKRWIYAILAAMFLAGVLASAASLARIYQFVSEGNLIDFWIYSPWSRSVGFLGQYFDLGTMQVFQIPKASHATFGLYLSVVLGIGLVFLSRARLISLQFASLLSGIGIIFSALLYTLSRGAVATGGLVLLGGVVLLLLRRKFLILGLTAIFLFVESAVALQLNPEVYQKLASTFPGAQKVVLDFAEISSPVGEGVIDAFERARNFIFSLSKGEPVPGVAPKATLSLKQLLTAPEVTGYSDLSLDQSLSDRVVMWQDTLRLLFSNAQFFLFGVGYSTDNVRHFTGGTVVYPHSLFLDLWARGGLTSLVLALVIWVLLFFQTVRFLFSRKSFVSASGFVLFGFLIGWFLDNAVSGEQFFSDAPMLAFWGTFGLILGLERLPIGKEEPLRILMISTTSKLGGGPQYVYQLLLALNKEKFRVVLAVPDDGPYFSRFRQIPGVVTKKVGVNKLRPWVLWDLYRVAQSHQVDLIHSHGKGAGLWGRLLGIIICKPVIHTWHGIHYLGYGRIIRPIYLSLEKLLTLFTDRFINVSKGEKSEAVKLGLYPARKAYVVPNGVDVESFRQVKVNRKLLRRQLGLGEKDIIFTTVARFHPQKGHEFLIQALPVVLKHLSSAKLLFVGDGEMLGQMKQLAKKLGVWDSCVFAGARKDVPDILKISDVFVFPSQHEGMPLAPMEAMASGVPVIATRVTGNEELLEGRAGLLVDWGDSSGLARAMVRLGSSAKLRENQGERGFRRVAKDYSFADTVAGVEKIYHAYRRDK